MKINFSSRNKLISMDFFFNGESKRLSRSGKDEGRKKWRGARVVTQDFHFPWKLLKKKTWPVSVLSFDRQRDLERLRTFPTFFAAAHYRIGRQREQKRSNFEKLETDGGETILLRGYERLRRVECSSSHLDEDLNKNPWLIRVHSAIVPLYISRIFAKTKRDICYVRGRRISLV